MSQRLRQYLAEIRVCRSLAASTGSFLRLLHRTLDFHAGNWLGRRRSDPSSAAESFSVVLNGSPRDLWLRPGSGDIFIFHEIFTNACYEIPRALLPTANVIVDLGANIGLTTLYLSRFFPEARFVCVEPNPFNAALLRRNTAWLADRVVVIEAAVADYCGTISFADSEWSWGGHIETTSPGSRTVPCLTLDRIFDSAGLDHVDLLKVDVEGAEQLVFSSPEETFARVGCIVAELHGTYTFSHFEKDLRPLGFDVLPEGSAAGNVMNTAVRRPVPVRPS